MRLRTHDNEVEVVILHNIVELDNVRMPLGFQVCISWRDDVTMWRENSSLLRGILIWTGVYQYIVPRCHKEYYVLIIVSAINSRHTHTCVYLGIAFNKTDSVHATLARVYSTYIHIYIYIHVRKSIVYPNPHHAYTLQLIILFNVRERPQDRPLA